MCRPVLDGSASPFFGSCWPGGLAAVSDLPDFTGSCRSLSSWVSSACLVVCAVSHGILLCTLFVLLCNLWCHNWAKRDWFSAAVANQMPVPASASRNTCLNKPHSRAPSLDLNQIHNPNIDLLGQHTKAAGQDPQPHNKRAAAIHAADNGARISCHATQGSTPSDHSSGNLLAVELITCDFRANLRTGER